MSSLSTDITFAGLTDVGLLRRANQDSFFMSADGELFIVADGMGGHTGGQEASRISTEVIRSYWQTHKASDLPSDKLLSQAILAANEAILAEQQRHAELADMGTTVVILMRRADQFWCAHVGDSRLYRLRESGFNQMTQDHTWVTQAMLSGELTPEQIEVHPWRHVLSQCVGRADLRQIETQQISVEPGDRLLLCSDGLTEELTSNTIITTLQSAQTCEEAVALLVAAAKERGGRDNITAVVIASADYGTLIQELGTW